MEECTQLISLSLNYFATYELYHIKPHFASKLVRLDWMAIATDEDWNLMRFDNFPCLEELRLGRQFAESTSCSLIATSSDSQLFQDETDFAVRVSTLLIRLFLGVLTCIYFEEPNTCSRHAAQTSALPFFAICCRSSRRISSDESPPSLITGPSGTFRRL